MSILSPIWHKVNLQSKKLPLAQGCREGHVRWKSLCHTSKSANKVASTNIATRLTPAITSKLFIVNLPIHTVLQDDVGN